MDPAALIARLTRRLFGSPILLNSLRGEVIEEMVVILEAMFEHGDTAMPSRSPWHFRAHGRRRLKAGTPRRSAA